MTLCSSRAHPRHRRGHHRVPARLLDGAPDPRQPRAAPHRDGVPQELRDHHPARRHPLGRRAVLEASSGTGTCSRSSSSPFIPTGIIGLTVYKASRAICSATSPSCSSRSLVGGIALIIFERFHERGRTEIDFSRDHLRQGAARSASSSRSPIIPGVSRSAATIVGGSLIGISKRTIVEFSFMLAVPTMLAASGLELLKNHSALAGNVRARSPSASSSASSRRSSRSSRSSASSRSATSPPSAGTASCSRSCTSSSFLR